MYSQMMFLYCPAYSDQEFGKGGKGGETMSQPGRSPVVDDDLVCSGRSVRHHNMA